MTSHRTISLKPAILVVVLTILAAPSSALANSLLGGYGGPGEGNQAILGSALVGGAGGGKDPRVAPRPQVRVDLPNRLVLRRSRRQAPLQRPARGKPDPVARAEEARPRAEEKRAEMAGWQVGDLAHKTGVERHPAAALARIPSRPGTTSRKPPLEDRKYWACPQPISPTCFWCSECSGLQASQPGGWHRHRRGWEACNGSSNRTQNPSTE